ncbi:hypothetical protein RB195_009880 [Necator americanus]|uniref:Uncharacterized protein n=1 Tax=Necator americanus TaxID=51031 RepID=A0ABR1CVC7_NECAM
MDCEMLLRRLRACAERASKPRTTKLARISKTTMELLERRRTLRFDRTAKKILEAAQRRTSLKKCRRDLREYNISLAALLSEDGTRMSSRREMEIITERFYSNLFRSSAPVSSPIISTGEALPRILPSEVRVAIKSMKPRTRFYVSRLSSGCWPSTSCNLINAHDILPSERKDPILVE